MAAAGSHALRPALARVQHPGCLHPTPQEAALATLLEGEVVTQRRDPQPLLSIRQECEELSRLAWSWAKLA